MKQFIIIFIVVAGIISCEKVLDVNLPEGEKHIVINGVLNPDSVLSVKISKSKSILDENQTIYLENAQAMLYENDIFIEDMIYKFNGNFVSSNNPVAGRTYRVEVAYPGLPSATAENTLPVMCEIVSSEVSFVVLSEENFDGDIFENYGIESTIKFKDDVNVNNYYFIGINTKREVAFQRQDGEYDYSYDYYDYIESDDIVFNSGNNDFKLEGMTGKVFTDDIFNGNSKTINFSTRVYNISENNNFTFCLATISEDLYKYIISYNKNKENGDNPFSQPVQIYSNIENGIGLFSGFSPSYATINIAL